MGQQIRETIFPGFRPEVFASDVVTVLLLPGLVIAITKRT